MKFTIQMLAVLLSVGMMGGCSENDPDCEETGQLQAQCEVQVQTIYDGLKEPVSRSESKEY